MLLDSNIIIYAALPENGQLRDWLDGQKLFTSIITQIEVLGFHKLTQAHKEWLGGFFQRVEIKALDMAVVDKAISLRQQRKMSLGDAIVAATALVYQLPLATHNIDDFKHIPDLQIIDPVSNPA